MPIYKDAREDQAASTSEYLGAADRDGSRATPHRREPIGRFALILKAPAGVAP